ncbi:hypothetical protein Bca52824_095887 [Brassica carinata]|uniref:U-box domain-containing protein n=1 Tax=Brassica carinata TaxID=52824 RepID=A0A8X7P1N2_BRACI|nr:hypothetical protein Bca52824_095887 [Brassica carinata]
MKPRRITVPTFFKCPISLDVMRSPVSLCTGVTYDRPSIQRWLDGGNSTCPATMQILKSKDLVPNLTLQRLIKAWSDSVGSSAAGSPDPASAREIPTSEEVNESLTRLSLEKDEEIRLEILSRIVRFSPKKDLVPMLVDIFVSAAKIKLVLLAIKILDTVIEKGNEGDRERLSNLMLTNGGDCLTAILLAIQRGDLESKIESVRVLEVISSLIKSIDTESDPNLIEASLSFLITISKSKRVRSKLIAAKTITKIRDILLTEETTSVAVTEKSLKLLEILSSKREGRSEICCGVSTAATEHAVTILWCLCHVFREDKTVEETVERSNGVTKLLVVIQSSCSPMVRQMAKDLIKVLKVKSSASALAAYETKTTHIMPF